MMKTPIRELFRQSIESETMRLNKNYREWTEAQLIERATLYRLSTEGTREVIKDRLIRSELRQFLGPNAASWDPVSDEFVVPLPIRELYAAAPESADPREPVDRERPINGDDYLSPNLQESAPFSNYSSFPFVPFPNYPKYYPVSPHYYPQSPYLWHPFLFPPPHLTKPHPNSQHFSAETMYEATPLPPKESESNPNFEITLPLDYQNASNLNIETTVNSNPHDASNSNLERSLRLNSQTTFKTNPVYITTFEMQESSSVNSNIETSNSEDAVAQIATIEASEPSNFVSSSNTLETSNSKDAVVQIATIETSEPSNFISSSNTLETLNSKDEVVQIATIETSEPSNFISPSNTLETSNSKDAVVRIATIEASEPSNSVSSVNFLEISNSNFENFAISNPKSRKTSTSNFKNISKLSSKTPSKSNSRNNLNLNSKNLAISNSKNTSQSNSFTLPLESNTTLNTKSRNEKSQDHCKKSYDKMAPYSNPVKIVDSSKSKICVDVNSRASTEKSTRYPCWVCQEKGHWAENCPVKQGKLCYKCGYKNVTIRTCPKCNPPRRIPREEYLDCEYVHAATIGLRVPGTVLPFGSSKQAEIRPDVQNCCWNCRKPGHRYSNCNKSRNRRFCYGCGKEGFGIKSCPKCKSRSSYSKARLSSSKPKINSPIEIHSHPLPLAKPTHPTVPSPPTDANQYLVENRTPFIKPIPFVKPSPPADLPFTIYSPPPTDLLTAAKSLRPPVTTRPTSSPVVNSPTHSSSCIVNPLENLRKSSFEQSSCLNNTLTHTLVTLNKLISFLVFSRCAYSSNNPLNPCVSYFE